MIEQYLVPLFDFSANFKCYQFRSSPFNSISKSNDNNFYNKIEFNDLFSKRDKDDTRRSSFYLEAEFDEEAYSFLREINFLMLAFRYSDLRISPFVKYKICLSSPEQSTIVSDTFTNNYCLSRKRLPYKAKELQNIELYFENLKDMYSKSARTKNAIDFSYDAMTSRDWCTSYMNFIIVLESLFSSDKKGSAKSVINSRIKRFFKSSEYSPPDLERIYSIRSEIFHGRLKSEVKSANLENLAVLEELVFNVMHKFIKDEKYNYFNNKRSRNNFLDE